MEKHFDSIKTIESGMTIIKVHPNDDDLDYHLFPIKVIEKTLNLLRDSSIPFDAIRGDDEHISMVPLAESGYNVEDLDASQVVAIQSKVDIADLFMITKYVNTHEGPFKVSLLKAADLPKFSDYLSPKAQESLPSEIQEALRRYMRMLINMTDGERVRCILDFSENASFGNLLCYYNDQVKEFILSHVSKRHAEELRKESNS